MIKLIYVYYEVTTFFFFFSVAQLQCDTNPLEELTCNAFLINEAFSFYYYSFTFIIHVFKDFLNVSRLIHTILTTHCFHYPNITITRLSLAEERDISVTYYSLQ